MGLLDFEAVSRLTQTARQGGADAVQAASLVRAGLQGGGGAQQHDVALRLVDHAAGLRAASCGELLGQQRERLDDHLAAARRISVALALNPVQM